MSSPSGFAALRRERVGTSAHEVPLAALRIPPSPPSNTRQFQLELPCCFLCGIIFTYSAHNGGQSGGRDHLRFYALPSASAHGLTASVRHNRMNFNHMTNRRNTL
jgi:hypothetical protein